MFIYKNDAKPNELIPLIAMGIITVAHNPAELHIAMQSTSQAKLLLQSPVALTDFQVLVLTQLLTCQLLCIYSTPRKARV